MNVSNMRKDYFKYIVEHKKNVFKTCWKRGLYLHAFTHDLTKFGYAEFRPYAEYFYGEWGVKIENSYLTSEPYTNGMSCLSRSYLKCKHAFDKAWIHHYRKNKHHWEHWCYDWKVFNYDNTFEDGNVVRMDKYRLETPREMPVKYIKQMICDWDAMSIKFGGTSQEFYMNNYDKIRLNRASRLELEALLGLIDMSVQVTWKEYCEKSGITMADDLKKLGYI